MTDRSIRAAISADAPAIAAIYNLYIALSVCTFEEEQLSDEQMRQRIASANANRPWLVLEEDGVLLGYVYATIWKARTAYNQSREVTVYLHRDATRNWRGRQLYQHLIDELRNEPIHSLIAGIALPNGSSVAMHESLGFTKAG